MFELRQRSVDIFRSWVSPFISVLFVGSFALAAFLIIYNTAFGKNPVADALAATIEHSTVLTD